MWWQVERGRWRGTERGTGRGTGKERQLHSKLHEKERILCMCAERTLKLFNKNLTDNDIASPLTPQI